MIADASAIDNSWNWLYLSHGLLVSGKEYHILPDGLDVVIDADL